MRRHILSRCSARKVGQEHLAAPDNDVIMHDVDACDLPPRTPSPSFSLWPVVVIDENNGVYAAFRGKAREYARHVVRVLDDNLGTTFVLFSRILSEDFCNIFLWFYLPFGHFRRNELAV